MAQPPCVARDVVANALAHADVVRRSRADVIVFPELSLTGYELDAAPVSLDDPAWSPLVSATGATGGLALVGALVAGPDGRRHIATVAVDGGGVRTAYTKTWLGGDESDHVSPGAGATALEHGGWRLGLAICKDTGVEQHLRDTAELGIDLFVAGLVDTPEDLPVQRARAATIARLCSSYVAFASCAGPTGFGYDATAGGSAVYDRDGSVLATAGDRPGELVTLTLP